MNRERPELELVELLVRVARDGDESRARAILDGDGAAGSLLADLASYFVASNLTERLRLMQVARTRHPASPELVILASRCLLNLGRLDDVDTNSKPLLAAEPQHPHIENLVAALSHARGDATAARQRLEALLQREPSVEAHQRLAAWLLEAGDLAGATRHIEDALYLAPANANVQVLRFEVELAAGRVEAAELAMRHALRLRPTDPRVRALPLELALHRGDLPGALRLLDLQSDDLFARAAVVVPLRCEAYFRARDAERLARALGDWRVDAEPAASESVAPRTAPREYFVAALAYLREDLEALRTEVAKLTPRYQATANDWLRLLEQAGQRRAGARRFVAVLAVAGGLIALTLIVVWRRRGAAR
ncbi:MAG: tetratricopeptide repeat protein [Planctomycetota bacterium]